MEKVVELIKNGCKGPWFKFNLENAPETVKAIGIRIKPSGQALFDEWNWIALADLPIAAQLDIGTDVQVHIVPMPGFRPDGFFIKNNQWFSNYHHNESCELLVCMVPAPVTEQAGPDLADKKMRATSANQAWFHDIFLPQLRVAVEAGRFKEFGIS